ncbi:MULTISPECIES: transcriptional repressor LexA [unclassified Candidatus Frackibacter]|uniref:transcriptional repressor LexA n=1 Tax=unclassified Candidatus Frackibacter TaxID=2648818 RepID=UPI00088594BD|nr:MULTISPECIES: transcriptional repressor LexA [unclassified Candidatus Frackibacter]SDC26514.1 repressor LexA [Candidatus Frackibacter sp. WG11]SEM53526.1 repressor LexA [Candidatus Frackibacter sp. WG12]SFL54977.1 repressor LexA [Candidatus Frackibacter sp. WG13]
MEDLSNRQQQILNFIMQEINQKGYPPSVREIAKAVGLSSPSTVHSHLTTLEEKEYIRKDPTKPRAIEVLYEPIKKQENDKEMINIPLVGRVTAGEPILAVENIEDTFPLPLEYISDTSDKLFILTVEGESMIEAGILDGDYVIVKKQNTARNKDIIVALLDDEATVKRFFKEEDHIRLQPENPNMEPIFTSDCKILGKVIGVYRKL